MLFIAAATATTLDKLKKVPPDFWWKLGLVIAALVVAVLILRKVAGMNKMVLAIIIFVVVTIIGFNWIYERNEPAFLTPIVNKIAPFFPSKGSYNAKQATQPLPPTPPKK
jgi:apolipoprotein N-acyltransferase